MFTQDGIAGWAHYAPEHEFWFGVVVLVVLALGGLWLLKRNLHRARLIEDTPTSLIRSAAQGYVELDGWGELLPGDPIIAPLSGERCLWYRYKVEEQVQRGDSRSWRTISSGVSDSLFKLNDPTGDCVVDPDGADIHPSVHLVWYGSSANPQANLPVHRPWWLRGLASERFRYHEERIALSESLYIIGQFSSVGGSQEVPDLRTELSQTLRDWKRDPQRMAQFDADGNGVIDSTEWEAARSAAKRHVSGEVRKRITAPASHLMRKPDGGRPYIISVIPQSRLALRYKLLAISGICAFFGAGGMLVWLLGLRMVV